MENINYSKIVRLVNAIKLRDELAINDTYYIAHVSGKMLDTYRTPGGVKLGLTCDEHEADRYETWAAAESAINDYLADNGIGTEHYIARVDARRPVGEIVDDYNIRLIGDEDNERIQIESADDWMKARARELKPVIVQYIKANRTANELLASLSAEEHAAYREHIEALAAAADQLRNAERDLIRKAQPKAARRLRRI